MFGTVQSVAYSSCSPAIMTQILTAVHPDFEDRVRRILPAHELILVYDLPAAQHALKEFASIGLVFVGVRFDESRMFDLLDYIRRDAKHRKTPIVAAIISPTNMSEVTVTGLAESTKLFGASVFINLNDFADDETENARLRIVVEALLLPEGTLKDAVRKISPLIRG